MIKIIKEDETISKDFEIKNIENEFGEFECAVYKNLSENFFDNPELLFLLEKRQLKRDEILIYSKYNINVNDENIDSLITLLKKYLDDDSLKRVMKLVFENLNYGSDLEKTEVLLFDELIKSEKEKIDGKKFFEIRMIFENILMTSNSWGMVGYSIEEFSEDFEKMQNAFEYFDEEDFEDDFEMDDIKDFKKISKKDFSDFCNCLDLSDDDLPF